MRLFIAEKPSLGEAIANGLGKGQRKDGCIEVGNNIVTWAFGHILRQADPDEYDEKYKKWRMNDLPILPDKWKLVVDKSCIKQFNIIKKLISQADEIVNAGDPDREGQLLVDEILSYVNNRKPVKRILINALDEKSVHTALNILRDNNEFTGLRESALARSRADWIVGINLSRAYSIKYGQKIKVGRVKTPTMALVVRREENIAKFKPITFYNIMGDFFTGKVNFDAGWEINDTSEGLDSENRLIDVNVAERLIDKFMAGDKKAVVKQIDTKEKKEAQRLPYSLSSLQIEAGKKYGYKPQTVLDTMQELYEKKLTTYPRSDCDFLPENQFSDASVIIGNLKNIKFADNSLDDIALWANNAILSIKSRAWNDKKISAHHAIIPTTVICNMNKLNDIQRNLYCMVAKAYIAQFYDLHIYTTTKLTIGYMNEKFIAAGKFVTQIGWKQLYPVKEKVSIIPNNLVEGDIVSLTLCAVKEGITTPPKRFTPSSLLQAMKEIHKYVKDDNLKSSLKKLSGIGTEATRASIIDDLISTGFLLEDKKVLIPSDIAKTMIKFLPEEITYPDKTALWEEKLSDITEGQMSLEAFLKEQADAILENISIAANKNIPPPSNAVYCPKCKTGILIKKKSPNGIFWGCNNYPECKTTFPDIHGKPNLTAKTAASAFRCPKCGKHLRRMNSKFGQFWGCEAYPNCKAIFKDKNEQPVIVFGK